MKECGWAYQYQSSRLPKGEKVPYAGTDRVVCVGCEEPLAPSMVARTPKCGASCPNVMLAGREGRLQKKDAPISAACIRCTMKAAVTSPANEDGNRCLVCVEPGCLEVRALGGTPASGRKQVIGDAGSGSLAQQRNKLIKRASGLHDLMDTLLNRAKELRKEHDKAAKEREDPPRWCRRTFAGGEARPTQKMAGAPGGDNERISSNFRTPTKPIEIQKKGKRGVGRVRKGRSSRDKGLPKGRGGASVTVAEQMSGEGSEQRSGPAEAIVARRSSRPEMPGWLLKEGADEEDESGSENKEFKKDSEGIQKDSEGL